MCVNFGDEILLRGWGECENPNKFENYLKIFTKWLGVAIVQVVILEIYLDLG